ncbi:MAG: hypothetical protein RQ875_09915 [Vicingaceae bacterium]|nr:hypothetical protein [Vicingaceae bacterium]
MRFLGIYSSITLLLVVGLNSEAVCQNNATTDLSKTYSNSIEIDAELLGFSFGFKHRIHQDLFFGTQFGTGLTLSQLHTGGGFTESSYFLEIIHLQFLLSYSLDDFILIETGPRISVFYNGESEIEMLSLATSGFIGFNNFKIGVRLGFFGTNFNKHNIITSSLLILRISLKKK